MLPCDSALQVIGKDKNVQNWQVYQDLKSDLETFRNMMLGFSFGGSFWLDLACMVWFEGIPSKQTTRCSMVFKCSTTFAKQNANAASRMPLITYLRADAMRERHIEAIVKEVKARCSKKEWTWDDMHCKTLDWWTAKDEANAFGSSRLFMKHNETCMYECVVYSFMNVYRLFSVYV